MEWLRRCTVLGLVLAMAGAAADYPAPAEGDWTLRDFRFASGETLPELRLHYRTIGRRGGRNAVLILHGTTGSGRQFLAESFAGELFGRGQLLDAERYYLILPDGIGHGGSSKPSDGLRARFPRYTYEDMVRAQYRLVREGLGVEHLRLVMGTSMGGMHTWMWGYLYPDSMDALMPLASLPAPIAGMNRVWRRMIIEAIRSDPGWNQGDYATPPDGLRTARYVAYLAGASNLRLRQQAPTLPAADALFDKNLSDWRNWIDANDLIYAYDASREYDPQPHLEKIRAPLLAVNSADDLINPPELGIAEREIRRVRRGKFVLLPISPQTRGHGTHTVAAVWKQHLSALLRSTERSRR